MKKILATLLISILCFGVATAQDPGNNPPPPEQNTQITTTPPPPNLKDSKAPNNHSDATNEKEKGNGVTILVPNKKQPSKAGKNPTPANQRSNEVRPVNVDRHSGRERWNPADYEYDEGLPNDISEDYQLKDTPTAPAEKGKQHKDKEDDKKKKIEEDHSGLFFKIIAGVLSIIAVTLIIIVLIYIRRRKKVSSKQESRYSYGRNNAGLSKNMPPRMSQPTTPEPIAPEVSVEEDAMPAPLVIPEEINGFADYSKEWTVVGVSVIGKGHIDSGLPCQDNNGHLPLGGGWGIAVTSDGAGSAVKSHIGSKITMLRAIEHFKTLVESKRWIESGVLPSDEEWHEDSYFTLRKVRDDVVRFAKEKNMDVSTLNATVIVVIYSPVGLLSCHVGDGRAGYCTPSGKWSSIITPHKGEEANQTIFLTSDFWNIPFFKISGVAVPESVVVRNPVSAFTLMSDGCENACWEYNMYDQENKHFFDPNRPYANFFNSIVNTLRRQRDAGASERELLEAWFEFIAAGNDKFRNETDDRTLILGVKPANTNTRK